MAWSTLSVREGTICQWVRDSCCVWPELASGTTWHLLAAITLYHADLRLTSHSHQHRRRFIITQPLYRVLFHTATITPISNMLSHRSNVAQTPTELRLMFHSHGHGSNVAKPPIQPFDWCYPALGIVLPKCYPV